MMFGLNNEKVIRKIDKLLDELAIIDRRVKEHEETADFAVRAGISQSDDNVAVREWRVAIDEMLEILMERKTALQLRREDFREVDLHLPMVRQAIIHFRKILDETDQLAAAGRAAARKRFGI